MNPYFVPPSPPYFCYAPSTTNTQPSLPQQQPSLPVQPQQPQQPQPQLPQQQFFSSNHQQHDSSFFFNQVGNNNNNNNNNINFHPSPQSRLELQSSSPMNNGNPYPFYNHQQQQYSYCSPQQQQQQLSPLSHSSLRRNLNSNNNNNNNNYPDSPFSMFNTQYSPMQLSSQVNLPPPTLSQPSPIQENDSDLFNADLTDENSNHHRHHHTTSSSSSVVGVAMTGQDKRKRDFDDDSHVIRGGDVKVQKRSSSNNNKTGGGWNTMSQLHSPMMMMTTTSTAATTSISSTSTQPSQKDEGGNRLNSSSEIKKVDDKDGGIPSNEDDQEGGDDAAIIVETLQELRQEIESKRAERKRVIKQNYTQLANNWNFDEEGDEYVLIHDQIVYPVPSLSYQQLYDYQIQGVKWLAERYLSQEMNGGILADDMGLGKTVQISVFIQGLFLGKLASRVMIVAPVSVLLNWEKEINKWVTGAKHIARFYKLTSEQARISCLESFEASVSKGVGSILLTTYGMITSQIELIEKQLNQASFDVTVLDEGHKIKNPNTAISTHLRRISSKCKFILTGTPIQNQIAEIWALYDWIFDGKLLKSQSEFKNSYERDIVHGSKRDASSSAKVLGNQKSLELRQFLAPFFLRREKHAVMKMSNETTGTNENPLIKSSFKARISQKNDLILWICLSKEQETAYRQYLASNEVRDAVNQNANPLTCLNALRQLCNHPSLLSKIETKDMNQLIKESGKLQVLIQLLKNLKANGHRVLIFSEYARMLDIVQKVLIEVLHFKILRIDGTVNSAQVRQNHVDEFNSDPTIDCFILTSQVGGIGLNLVGADRVIIVDPSWNPAIDNQAVDRAYRIGQRRNVIVYRFITCSTVEENMYRKQVFKDGLSKTTIDKENQYRYFNQDELIDQFSLSNPRYSKTQTQLGKLHANERITYPELEDHLKEVNSWAGVFGISDHDLLFKKEADDDLTDVPQNIVVARPSLEYQHMQLQAQLQEQRRIMLLRQQHAERVKLLSQSVIDVDSLDDESEHAPVHNGAMIRPAFTSYASAALPVPVQMYQQQVHLTPSNSGNQIEQIIDDDDVILIE